MPRNSITPMQAKLRHHTSTIDNHKRSINQPPACGSYSSNVRLKGSRLAKPTRIRAVGTLSLCPLLPLTPSLLPALLPKDLQGPPPETTRRLQNRAAVERTPKTLGAPNPTELAPAVCAVVPQVQHQPVETANRAGKITNPRIIYLRPPAPIQHATQIYRHLLRKPCR